MRIGLPKPSPKMLAFAKLHGYPVLLSANAFARRYPRSHPKALAFKDFRMPPTASLQGLDAALDSSGFVAATRYPEYPWPVAEYVDLAAAHPWTWWAAMDYCCEPELARDREQRSLRIAATLSLYLQCAREAERRGLCPPLPVLQGWTSSEFLYCPDHLPVGPWPALVGVGSMCRRHVHGRHGVLEVVEALDRVLPPHTKLHLFGVSRAALTTLANHPRVTSTDSMAWDAHARRARPTGRTTEFRLECMRNWAAIQEERVTQRAHGAGFQQNLSLLLQETASFDLPASIREAFARDYADLITAGSLSYLDASWYFKQDVCTLSALDHQRRLTSLGTLDLDAVFSALPPRVIELFNAAAN
jgi:hypothetical protein